MDGYLYMYTCLISSDEFIRLEDGSWLDLSRRKVAAIERFQRANDGEGYRGPKREVEVGQKDVSVSRVSSNMVKNGA